MPVLMSRHRLRETGTLLRSIGVPFRWQPSLAEHSPYTGRPDRHDVGIQRHDRQPPVTFQGVLQMEPDDGLLLPLLQAASPGKPAVVLVHLAVAFPPVMDITGGGNWMLGSSSLWPVGDGFGLERRLSSLAGIPSPR